MTADTNSSKLPLLKNESFTGGLPVRPGRYIRRFGHFPREELMTVVKKDPLDLVYILDGKEEDEDHLRRQDALYGATYCKFVPSSVAEVCYAEGWHAAQYAAQKLLGSYFPSYWNNDTVSKDLAD